MLKLFSWPDRFILLLALLAFGGAVYFLRHDDLLTRIKRQGAPYGHIVDFENDVRLRDAKEFVWIAAHEGLAVLKNDSIYVGEASKARIRLEDGEILEVGPNSLVVFNVQSDKLDIELKLGSGLLQTMTGQSVPVKRSDTIRVGPNQKAAVIPAAVEPARKKVTLSLPAVPPEPEPEPPLPTESPVALGPPAPEPPPAPAPKPRPTRPAKRAPKPPSLTAENLVLHYVQPSGLERLKGETPYLRAELQNISSSLAVSPRLQVALEAAPTTELDLVNDKKVLTVLSPSPGHYEVVVRWEDPQHGPLPLVKKGLDITVPGGLGAPRVLFPKKGQLFLVGENVTDSGFWIKGSPVKQATSYIFQLSPEPKFQKVKKEVVSADYRVVITDHLPNGSWYVRMAALSDTGYSEWSPVVRFRVGEL